MSINKLILMDSLTRISHTPPITAAYCTKSIGENGDLDAQRSTATPPLKIAIFSYIFSTLRSIMTVVYGISGLKNIALRLGLCTLIFASTTPVQADGPTNELTVPQDEYLEVPAERNLLGDAAQGMDTPNGEDGDDIMPPQETPDAAVPAADGASADTAALSPSDTGTAEGVLAEESPNSGAITREVPAVPTPKPSSIKVKVAPSSASAKVSIATASSERVAAAIGHYARSRSLLIAAIREFDRGMAKADASPLLDTANWRESLITRAAELERVLDPKPRESRTGVRFEADPRLLGEANRP